MYPKDKITEEEKQEAIGVHRMRYFKAMVGGPRLNPEVHFPIVKRFLEATKLVIPHEKMWFISPSPMHALLLNAALFYLCENKEEAKQWDVDDPELVPKLVEFAVRRKLKTTPEVFNHTIGNASKGPSCFYEFVYIMMKRRDMLTAEMQSEEILSFFDMASQPIYKSIYTNQYMILVEGPSQIEVSDWEAYRKAEGITLHSYERPAIQFRDGTKHYFVHGIQVDADWIEKPETLLDTQYYMSLGTDERVIASDILLARGYEEHYETEVLDSYTHNAKLPMVTMSGEIQYENHPVTYILHRTKNVDPHTKTKLLFLKYHDPSTGRKYNFSAVPDTHNGKKIKTALQAYAWKFDAGMDGGTLLSSLKCES